MTPVAAGVLTLRGGQAMKGQTFLPQTVLRNLQPLLLRHQVSAELPRTVGIRDLPILFVVICTK